MHRKRFLPGKDAIAILSPVVQDRVAEGGIHACLRRKQLHDVDVAAPVDHAVHLLQPDHLRLCVDDQIPNPFDVHFVIHPLTVMDIVTHNSDSSLFLWKAAPFLL